MTTSSNEVRQLRKLLWLNHGCPVHYLYGNDGEMQSCNRKRHMPIDLLEQQIMPLLLELLALLCPKRSISSKKDETLV
jgi:hypothetical protein